MTLVKGFSGHHNIKFDIFSLHVISVLNHHVALIQKIKSAENHTHLYQGLYFLDFSCLKCVQGYV